VTAWAEGPGGGVRGRGTARSLMLDPSCALWTFPSLPAAREAVGRRRPGDRPFGIAAELFPYGLRNAKSAHGGRVLRRGGLAVVGRPTGMAGPCATCSNDGLGEFGTLSAADAPCPAYIIMSRVAIRDLGAGRSVWIGMSPKSPGSAQPIVDPRPSFTAEPWFPFATAVFVAGTSRLPSARVVLIGIGAHGTSCSNVSGASRSRPTARWQ